MKRASMRQIPEETAVRAVFLWVAAGEEVDPLLETLRRLLTFLQP